MDAVQLQIQSDERNTQSPKAVNTEVAELTCFSTASRYGEKAVSTGAQGCPCLLMLFSPQAILGGEGSPLEPTSDRRLLKSILRHIKNAKSLFDEKLIQIGLC